MWLPPLSGGGLGWELVAMPDPLERISLLNHWKNKTPP